MITLYMCLCIVKWHVLEYAVRCCFWNKIIYNKNCTCDLIYFSLCTFSITPILCVLNHALNFEVCTYVKSCVRAWMYVCVCGGVHIGPTCPITIIVYHLSNSLMFSPQSLKRNYRILAKMCNFRRILYKKDSLHYLMPVYSNNQIESR